jgi:hypothetical protein
MTLHELSLVDGKEIDLFLASREVSVKRRSEYRKILVAWQQYMRKQYPDAKVAPVELEPFIEPAPPKGWKPANYAFEDEGLPMEDDDPFAGAVSI